MPISQQPTIDAFFTSNFDYNIFLAWLQKIKSSLVSTDNVDTDPAIIARVIQTAFISTAVQTYNQDEMATQERLMNPSSDPSSGINGNSNWRPDVPNSTGTNIGFIQPYGQEQAVYSNIVNRINDTIRTEVVNRINSDADLNNPIPPDQRIDGTNNKFGSVQETYLGGTYLATDFPNYEAVNTSGTYVSPVDDAILRNSGVTSEITTAMNNTTQFEVVSGYKPKTDKTPPAIEYKGWVIPTASFAGSGGKITETDSLIPDSRRTFLQSRPYSEYANEVLDALNKIDNNGQAYPGSYKFFIEQLHGRHGNGKPYSINAVKSQTSVLSPTNLKNRMVFSAYIDNYYDNYSVNWGEYNFIGRADPTMSYKSTTRDITLTFTLLSDYSLELMVAMEQLYATLNSAPTPNENSLLEQLLSGKNIDWGLGQITPPKIYEDGRVGGHVPGMYSDTPEGLWSKITFLAQCCYPYYRKDGKMKEQPMVRMRIADFYDVIVCLKSMALEMNEFDSMIDMNPSSIGNMPFGMKVTLTGVILHNYEPASDFYGFYHRKEFDAGTMNQVTGVKNGIYKTSLQKSTMQRGSTKKSPTSFSTTFNNEKLLTPADIEGYGDYGDGIAAIQNFQNQYSVLKNNTAAGQQPGVVLASQYSKQQTQIAMDAYQSVQEVLNYLKILQGTPIGTSPLTTLSANGGTQPPTSAILTSDSTAIPNGLGTTSIDTFNQAVANTKSAAKNPQTVGSSSNAGTPILQNTLGTVNPNISPLQPTKNNQGNNNSTNSKNSDLLKIGANLFQNEIVGQAINAINSSKLPSQLKTIADIVAMAAPVVKTNDK